jgi:predicted dehydrogenase
MIEFSDTSNAAADRDPENVRRRTRFDWTSSMKDRMRTCLRIFVISCVLLSLFLIEPSAGAGDLPPVRLAIAGLVHGHVSGFLDALKNRDNVKLVGVFDPDPQLRKMYAQRYGLPESAFFADLETMLDQAKPEAVASFTSTYDHPEVVEACALRHIHVMMEKPLAVSMEHARRIQRAAVRGAIQVIVNYETTWYRSHRALWELIKTQQAAGDIRKMVAMDGHQGPMEIGVGPEFLGWLTDPAKNGGGALFDFGCYGANLMTWLMDNQRPLAVTAITQRIKPQIYARVDDEATVLVEYPKAQGIIQASWNWPFNRKDFEVYGEHGYALATGGNLLRVRLRDRQEEARTPPALPAVEADSISYLDAVVRGRQKPSGLSSLENNLIVTEILEMARESARLGKTIKMQQ